MPHIEGVLPCQLTLTEVTVLLNDAIMLDAGVLEAGEGPFGLEELFSSP